MNISIKIKKIDPLDINGTKHIDILGSRQELDKLIEQINASKSDYKSARRYIDDNKVIVIRVQESGK